MRTSYIFKAAPGPHAATSPVVRALPLRSRRAGSRCKADRETAALIGQAIQHVINGRGPDEGRPLVDRIKGSRLRNLKELRPASSGGTEVRILFLFDPARQMLLLVAGDKAGNWQRWYDAAIPLAEARYAEFLAALNDESD